MNKNSLILLVAIVFAWTSSKAIANSDDAFLQARQAYYAKDAREFEQQASRIGKNYVLYPYLEYWRINRDLGAAGDAAIADFLASHADTWLAEKLRADWLRDLGQREFWAAFLPEYSRLGDPDLTLQCYARRAELASGNFSNLRNAIGLWFSGGDLPSACTALFVQLISRGYLSQEDIWRRLRLALFDRNPEVAKSVATALPAEIRPDASEIDQAGKDPVKALTGNGLDMTRRADREIALYALGVLAKSDPDKAAEILARLSASLPDIDRRAAWGLVAYRAAWSHHPKALIWFEKSGMGGLSDRQREWWVRSALRAGQWRKAFEVINSMSAESQNQIAWRYWKARALKNMGQVYAANALLGPLSKEYNFYGQLAAEELGQTMENPVANIRVSGDEIQKVAQNPAIARALALYNLGLRSEAADEWKWAIRNDSDRDLLAAAELARQQQWIDRAINTAEKTREQHNFDLRFLAPFRDQASAYAKKYQIDEAWVYGVIRQESRFVSEAKSGAGAMGLMQLMPSTARWIARKLGLARFKVRDAHDPETNIKFGAYYLRTLLDSLGNQPVLATAGYNAGPRRAQRWRDDQPMEAAVYIESIPFTETREYVKKVMSNAMFYAVRFGQSSSLLKDRLGEIPGLGQPAPLATSPEDRSPALEGDSVGG
ncbi:MAG: transglycosylase SLT domain-containing protein [Thiobacillaceae bacterium]